MKISIEGHRRFPQNPHRGNDCLSDTPRENGLIARTSAALFTGTEGVGLRPETYSVSSTPTTTAPVAPTPTLRETPVTVASNSFPTATTPAFQGRTAGPPALPAPTAGYLARPDALVPTVTSTTANCASGTPRSVFCSASSGKATTNSWSNSRCFLLNFESLKAADAL